MHAEYPRWIQNFENLIRCQVYHALDAMDAMFVTLIIFI